MGRKQLQGICLAVLVGCLIYLGRYFWNGYSHRTAAAAVSAAYTSSAAAGNLERDSVMQEQSQAQSQEQPQVQEEAFLTVDFSALQGESEAVCAWLSIPAIEGLSYPVVWSGEDEYYLHHAWDGTEDSYGAIFVEGKNARDFSDLYTIVYGHNMRNGTMFGSLKAYLEESFYRENGGTVLLALPGEGTRVYEIFSVETVEPTEPGVYSLGFGEDAVYWTFLQQMKARSLYDTGVEVEKGDKVITLSTCQNNGKDRFVVHAKLTQQE